MSIDAKKYVFIKSSTDRGIWKTCISCLCIFICTFLTGVKQIELPGVYFDAVYPDYLGAIGAFPEHDNFTQITQHMGLPLLGNLYHGTITAGVQWLILKCVGRANVYTLRCVNLFYIAILGCIVFYVIRKVSGKNIFSLVMAILCVTAENIYVLSRTQYYIMLPGCIFYFLSVFFLFDIVTFKNRKANILTAGIFEGLAFYGYFSYLFMAPASLVVLWIKEKDKNHVENSVIYIIGLLIGSIGYIWGYFDSAIVNLFGTGILAHIVFYGGAVFALFSLLLIALGEMKTNDQFKKMFNKAIAYVFLGTLIILMGGILSIWLGMPEKMTVFTKLFNNIRYRNEGGLLIVFWMLFAQILSNRSGWHIIFQQYANSWSSVWLYVWLGETLITGIIMLLDYKVLKKRNTRLSKVIGVGYLYLFGYYITSLPIVRGMQPQHFVIVYFGAFIIMGVEACYIFDHFPPKITKALCPLLAVALISLNICNDWNFVQYLTKTEGRGKYSKTVDEFIYEAMKLPSNNQYVYVFPEWGFSANFIYLTSNQYEVIRHADVDLELLQKKIDEGYKVVIAAWNKEEIDNLISQMDCCVDSEDKWYSKEEMLLFTSVELSKF